MNSPEMFDHLPHENIDLDDFARKVVNMPPASSYAECVRQSREIDRQLAYINAIRGMANVKPLSKADLFELAKKNVEAA